MPTALSPSGTSPARLASASRRSIASCTTVPACGRPRFAASRRRSRAILSSRMWPPPRRHPYVGIDNIAAGRTAGALVGRLVGPRSGKVAIVAGSQGLRDHAERIFGFNQVMASEFPGLNVLPLLEGRDEDERSAQLMTKLLSKHP